MRRGKKVTLADCSQAGDIKNQMPDFYMGRKCVVNRRQQTFLWIHTWQVDCR